MPRTARIVVEGYPHHITQRGNNRQDVFFVDADRLVYLSYLKRESEKHGLELLGYCLMTNHIHLIVVPFTPDSLARVMGRTHFRYTQYINRYHGRSGHLWQNRFYSCVMDESRCVSAMKYIERNPVRAKMVRKAWNYEWSSAAAHTGKKAWPDFLEQGRWKKLISADKWERALVEKDDDDTGMLLRGATSTGRPLGSDSFLSKLEAMAGHRLRPLPIGRPRKGNK